MTCGMHKYYLVLHVHIHITSKNDDICKLCATERIRIRIRVFRNKSTLWLFIITRHSVNTNGQ